MPQWLHPKSLHSGLCRGARAAQFRCRCPANFASPCGHLTVFDSHMEAIQLNHVIPPYRPLHDSASTTFKSLPDILFFSHRIFNQVNNIPWDIGHQRLKDCAFAVVNGKPLIIALPLVWVVSRSFKFQVSTSRHPVLRKFQGDFV